MKMLFLYTVVVVSLNMCSMGITNAQSVHDVGDYDYHYGDYNYDYNHGSSDPAPVLGQRTPSISWITKQQLVEIGMSVELTCSVQYAQDNPVMWMKRGTNDTQDQPIAVGPMLIIRDRRYTISQGQDYSAYTLQIRDIQESDGGEYMCQVILGVSNRISASTILTVRRRPSVTMPVTTSTTTTKTQGSYIHGQQVLPPVLNITEEVIITKTDQVTEELVITCMGQQPLKWHTPQCHPPCCHEMEVNDVVDIINSNSTNVNYPFASTLKVLIHRSIHTGLYSCMYKDSTDNDHEMKVSTYVYFHEPDGGVKLADNIFEAIDITIGSTLVVDCRPTHPDHTVSLQFDYEDVDLASDERIEFNPQKGFIINNTTKEDGGDYACDPYKHTSVNIKDKLPSLPKPSVEYSVNQHFAPGEDFTLICIPEDFIYVLEIQWTGPRRSHLYNITVKDPNTNKIRSYLTVHNATMEDSGNYSCSIKGPCRMYDYSEATTISIHVKDLGCPSDWQSLNGDCFYIHREHKTWLDAKTFCESQGAFLAQPTNVTQVQALAGLLREPGLSLGTFWVGGHNQASTTYRWLNGSQVTGGWRKNQPSTTDPGRCVAMRYYHALTGHNEGSLEVQRCSNSARFICQISEHFATNKSQANTTPTTIAKQGTEVIPNCYICDNYPDTVGKNRYDPYCGMDGYQGSVLQDPSSHLVKTCFTSIHYDGSHRVIRDASKQIVADGLCYDSGFAVTCSCTPTDTRPYCNTDLCQHCDIPKPNN